jgi:hypothetical protein
LLIAEVDNWKEKEPGVRVRGGGVAGGVRAVGGGVRVGGGGVDYASNAMGNFCFDIELTYRRLERPRRVAKKM